MTEGIKQRATGFQFLCLALYAFAGLGLEMLLAFLIEPMLFGAPMGEWTTAQHIIHWVVTCICWGIVCLALVRVSKRSYGFDLFAGTKKMTALQWLLVAGCLAFSLVVSYVSWEGFKVVKEFQSNGLLRFVFQYIYYLAETMVFLLIIVFGQKACEIWFKRENIPYGGIVVALTWGLGHILSKGSLETGLLSALSGFIFGAAYLLTNRNIRITYPLLFLLFVL